MILMSELKCISLLNVRIPYLNGIKKSKVFKWKKKKRLVSYELREKNVTWTLTSVSSAKLGTPGGQAGCTRKAETECHSHSLEKSQLCIRNKGRQGPQGPRGMPNREWESQIQHLNRGSKWEQSEWRHAGKRQLRSPELSRIQGIRWESSTAVCHVTCTTRSSARLSPLSLTAFWMVGVIIAFVELHHSSPQHGPVHSTSLKDSEKEFSCIQKPFTSKILNTY